MILDVVYNHTAEGNHLGPMLSFKGVDNEAYYRLSEEDKRYYVDYTGTGNTLNMRHPHVLQLLMDSLRYWVLEMHVDGFRFDLAATLARTLHDVDRLSAFFDVIQQDPVISQVKLIAEPWDVGEGGYQVGNFPPLWSEWNGQYRDSVRDFWRGQEQGLGEFAARLTGSSDLYEATGRRPSAVDQLRHRARRLHARRPRVVQREAQRGERRRRTATAPTTTARGTAASKARPTTPTSSRCGAASRRNFLATLFLSQGVPMLLAGDEIGRTQAGNNNAYCQDNEISWIDWENVDEELLDVHEHAQRHPPRAAPCSAGAAGSRAARSTAPASSDIAWFKPDGSRMTDEDWQAGVRQDDRRVPQRRHAAVAGPRRPPGAQRLVLPVFNAHYEPIEFTVPGEDWGREWWCRARHRPHRGRARRAGAQGERGRPGERPQLRPPGAPLHLTPPPRGC